MKVIMVFGSGVFKRCIAGAVQQPFTISLFAFSKNSLAQA